MLKGLLKGASKILLPKLIKKILGEGKAIKKAKINLDRNGDGKINLKDFPELVQYADINGDGKVNIADLIALADKNNRQKLFIAIGVAIVGGIAYYFLNKNGLI